MTDTVSTTPSQPGPPSLFERLGGEPAIGAVADAFYEKVLGHPALRPYFTGVDLERLKRHQRRFVGQVLGPTRPYSSRSTRTAHEHLSITEDAFDRVVRHLAASIAEAGADKAAINTVAQVLLPLRQDIVTA